MAATVQARRVIDALKGIGLRHGSWKRDGDFLVSTHTRRRRSSTGYRYSEFLDAYSHLNDRKACAVVEANAQALADQELTVSLVYSEGKLVTAIVTSKHNPRRTVSYLRDGKWEFVSPGQAA